MMIAKLLLLFLVAGVVGFLFGAWRALREFEQASNHPSGGMAAAKKGKGKGKGKGPDNGEKPGVLTDLQARFCAEYISAGVIGHQLLRRPHVMQLPPKFDYVDYQTHQRKLILERLNRQRPRLIVDNTRKGDE